MGEWGIRTLALQNRLYDVRINRFGPCVLPFRSGGKKHLASKRQTRGPCLVFEPMHEEPTLALETEALSYRVLPHTNGALDSTCRHSGLY